MNLPLGAFLGLVAALSSAFCPHLRPFLDCTLDVVSIVIAGMDTSTGTYTSVSNCMLGTKSLARDSSMLWMEFLSPASVERPQRHVKEQYSPRDGMAIERCGMALIALHSLT
ncbi:hypothetical protein GOP47_0010701 [Adiantum capillus-veneris]|uniref:Secreted protein n=1 Tax=Adiantum capillus-veneris TaxID=13818 RepID=A0A9D4ZJ17_ADICA|nr:hypothetical protein GOP47_0010701 [Adiantum capillus-veneris]